MANESSDAPPQFGDDKRRRIVALTIRPDGVLSALGAFVAVISVLGFVGRHHWVLDLFSHFRMQCSLTLVIVSGVLWFIYRSHRWAICFALVGLVNLWTLLPLFIQPAPAPESPPTRIYKALQANVDRPYGDPNSVINLIEVVNPDFLLLEEISEEWLDKLEGILQRYPHSFTKPRMDNFGIGFFSKHPILDGSVKPVGDAAIPTCSALIDLPEGPLRIIGTHPVPPVGWRGFQLRNQQLQAIGGLVSDSTTATVVWGDLNATPWSIHFKELLRSSGLRDSGRGWGFQPTWPNNNPFLWIPIDHFLHSERIHVYHREVGPNVRSDHYPLIVHFAVESGE